MVVPIIVGIALLLIVIYIALKILKNIVFGIILIGLALFASFLIFGSIPNLRDIPFIGKLLPVIPTTPGEVVIAVKNILYNVDILGYSRDSQGNLLIAVMNTGKSSVSNFTVYVDNQKTNILNPIKPTLNSKTVEIIQTDWKSSFSSILVQTNEVNATYRL